jgi:hypothetical protein
MLCQKCGSVIDHVPDQFHHHYCDTLPVRRVAAMVVIDGVHNAELREVVRDLNGDRMAIAAAILMDKTFNALGDEV